MICSNYVPVPAASHHSPRSSGSGACAVVDASSYLTLLVRTLTLIYIFS